MGRLCGGAIGPSDVAKFAIGQAAYMSIQVNVDNFIRAESDRMFGDSQRDARGVNQFKHNREPTPIDKQTAGCRTRSPSCLALGKKSTRCVI